MDNKQLYNNTEKQVINKILNSYTKNIAITFHNSPDSDAIGSAVGLSLGLQQIGKKTMIFTKNFSSVFMPIMKQVPYCNSYNNVYDLTILLDCSEKSRTISFLDDLSKEIITIDHHIGNHKIGNIYLCEPQASTSIIIYNLLKQMNINISSPIATALYLGIVGDTYYFSSHNMSPTVHYVAGKLLESNIDINIINSIYKTKTLEMVKLMSEVLSDVIIDKKYKIAYSILSIDILNKYNLSYDITLTESLINEIKFIRDIEVAFLFMEGKNNTRIKARSNNSKICINKIMQSFGGGGHEYAAGALIDSVNIYHIIDMVLLQTKLYIDTAR